MDKLFLGLSLTVLITVMGLSIYGMILNGC